MDIFQEKVYNLNEKLQALSKQQPIFTESEQSLSETLQNLNQRCSQAIFELEEGYALLIAKLDQYQLQIDHLKMKKENQIDELIQQYQQWDQEIRAKQEGLKEQIEGKFNKTYIEFIEQISNIRNEYVIKQKKAKKEIDKQVGSITKKLGSKSDYFQISQCSFNDKKLFAVYEKKVMQIEKNERKIAERINQIENSVQRRILRFYQNITNKIKVQQKQTKAKFEKLKRLFSLLLDID